MKCIIVLVQKYCNVYQSPFKKSRHHRILRLQGYHLYRGEGGCNKIFTGQIVDTCRNYSTHTVIFNTLVQDFCQKDRHVLNKISYWYSTVIHTCVPIMLHIVVKLQNQCLIDFLN